jgi:branched-chain amino acid transport system permease protein
MDMLQTSIDGLMMGSTYALLGLSFALVFGVMRRINLAFGACILFGASLAIYLEPMLGWGAWGLFLVTIVGAALASSYVERLCFAPHGKRQGDVTAMVASFAVWMQLDEISSQLLPQRTHAFQGIEVPNFWWGELFVRGDQLLHFAIALVSILLLYLLLYKTRFGLLVRATADSSETAHLLGAPVPWLGFVIFLVAGILGGLAAFMILSADGYVTPLFGLWSTFKGLVAMIIGGVGSLVGAVLGGLILGLVETHAGAALGAEFRDMVTFGMVFLVLIIRPGGLMGVKIYRTDSLAQERV